MRVLAIIAATLALLMGVTPARAQGYGPPDAPAIAAPGVVPAAIRNSLNAADNAALSEGALSDPFNPASILAGAASALPGVGQGGVSDGAGGSANGSKGAGLSTAMNVILVLTVVSLVPSIMLMTTCFLRIVIVLGILKQALGTQQMPPSQVLLGLSLILTLLVMSPTLDRINSEAITPYRAGKVTNYEDLWDKAKRPLRDFMFDQIDASGNHSSLYMVMNYRGIDTSDPSKLRRGDVDMISLIPAFVLSELKVAFLMGFRIYLPFLVIDMVISAILIAMNMMMLPPVLISLPFKLLLFVLVDGWTLVVGTLLASFARSPVGTTGPPGAAVSAMMEQIETARQILMC